MEEDRSRGKPDERWKIAIPYEQNDAKHPRRRDLAQAVSKWRSLYRRTKGDLPSSGRKPVAREAAHFAVDSERANAAGIQNSFNLTTKQKRQKRQKRKTVHIIQESHTPSYRLGSNRLRTSTIARPSRIRQHHVGCHSGANERRNGSEICVQPTLRQRSHQHPPTTP